MKKTFIAATLILVATSANAFGTNSFYRQMEQQRQDQLYQQQRRDQLQQQQQLFQIQQELQAERMRRAQEEQQRMWHNHTNRYGFPR